MGIYVNAARQASKNKLMTLDNCFRVINPKAGDSSEGRSMQLGHIDPDVLPRDLDSSAVLCNHNTSKGLVVPTLLNNSTYYEQINANLAGEKYPMRFGKL